MADNFRISLGAELSKDINIQKDLDKIKGLHITVDNIAIGKEAVDEIKAQLSKAGTKINLDVNVDTKTAINQVKEVSEQIQKASSKIIQKGDFKHTFGYDGLNKAGQEAEDYFKTLSKVVSVQEKLGNAQNLEGFTVSLKNADGIIEKINYSITDLIDKEGKVLGQVFNYSGGSVNDNGVIQQFTKISSKADDLALKLEKLKFIYTDMNAPKAIKDTGHISELATQYDKVKTAIDAVKSSDSATFQAMVSNANREISALENMVTKFKNAEYAATSLRAKNITTIKVDEGNELNAFVEKMQQSGHFTSELQTKVTSLQSQLANVFDSSSLTEYLNNLSNLQTEFKSVNAAAITLEKATKLQTNIDTEQNKLSNWKSELQSTGKLSDELAAKFQTLENKLANVTTQNGLSTWRAELKSLESDVNQYAVSLKAAADAEKLVADKARILSNIDRILAQNTAMTKELRQKFIELRETIDSIDDSAPLRNLNSRVSKLNNEMKASGKFGPNFTDSLKQNVEKFTNWFFIGGTVASTVRSIKQIYQNVYDLDTAMTNLYKVTDETDSKYNQFLKEASKNAKDLGSTITSLVTQTSEWAKLGFSLDESKNLAKVSSIYANVGEVDDKTAVSDIITAMKAFNIEAKNSINIVDQLNELGNKYTLSSADLGEGLKRSASSMALANNSIQQTLAMITGGAEITQEAGEMGNTLKILSMRIRGKQKIMPIYYENNNLCYAV